MQASQIGRDSNTHIECSVRAEPRTPNPESLALVSVHNIFSNGSLQLCWTTAVFPGLKPWA